MKLGEIDRQAASLPHTCWGGPGITLPCDRCDLRGAAAREARGDYRKVASRALIARLSDVVGRFYR